MTERQKLRLAGLCGAAVGGCFAAIEAVLKGHGLTAGIELVVWRALVFGAFLMTMVSWEMVSEWECKAMNAKREADGSLR